MCSLCAVAVLALLMSGADPTDAANAVSSPGADIAYAVTAGVDALVEGLGASIGLLLGVFVLAPIARRDARKRDPDSLAGYATRAAFRLAEPLPFCCGASGCQRDSPKARRH
jgi:hypothetical protein